MSLQDILRKILDDAAENVAQIESDVVSDLEKIREEFVQREKQESAQIEKKTKDALKSVEEKTRSMARRQNSQSLLEAKHKVLESFFEAFLHKLEQADEKTYKQILDKLFEQLSVSSGKILAPPKRLEITSKCAPGGFDVVAHKNISGGFLVHSGGTEIDNSFRSLVFSEFREPLMLHLSEELKFVS